MTAVRQLLNKVSIVTGAASGIGLAVCQRFANEGSKLVLVDVNGDALKQVSSSLEFPQSQIVCKQGDVSEAGFAESVMQTSLESFGEQSTILVNSAGIASPLNMMNKTTDEIFDKVMQGNLHGTFMFIRAFLNQFNFSDHEKINEDFSANIVNISSMAGKLGMVGQASYAASKSAIVGLTKTVALEFGKHGVRCNAMLPGAIDTPMTSQLPSDYLNQAKALIPLGRLGKPYEIANSCLFLSSSESSYVNGACLEVSGGYMA